MSTIGSRAPVSVIDGLIQSITFSRSIRRKIVGIALGLVILMVVTSVLSIVMSQRVSRLLDELTDRYIPAYNHLANADVMSLKRALALRRMVIAKMQVPPDEEGYRERLQIFNELDARVGRETERARAMINAIMADPTTPSDNVALARIDARIESATTELRRELSAEDTELVKDLDAGRLEAARRQLPRIDLLRDQFIEKIDSIRTEMLSQVFASTATVIGNQWQTLIISGVVTVIAAALGLIFASLVAGGIARPVRQLLQGAREVGAGHFENSIRVTTKDEIGELSAAFNSMIEQLRRNERVREVFGRYIDPKIVEGLIDHPDVAAAQGDRRVMTVMFCDLKGFTAMSEGMTPQGLVKVVNCYFSLMSEPVRQHRGIIDKYIGDAIMAYWGPPFVDADAQASLACSAALAIVRKLPELRARIPELLGLKRLPAECDLRIGIATGEVLAGSIGSELMMNFTVMGDAVNLASRLEAINKEYETRILVAQETASRLGDAFTLREVDRIRVVGQAVPQIVYEVMEPDADPSERSAALRRHYAGGLGAYRAGRWDEARSAFEAALAVAPDDGPSRVLLARVMAFASHPPPAGWDGTWQFERK